MLFSFFFGPYAARLQIVEVSQCCVNLMRLSWARMAEGAEKKKKKNTCDPLDQVLSVGTLTNISIFRCLGLTLLGWSIINCCRGHNFLLSKPVSIYLPCLCHSPPTFADNYTKRPLLSSFVDFTPCPLQRVPGEESDSPLAARHVEPVKSAVRATDDLVRPVSVEGCVPKIVFTWASPGCRLNRPLPGIQWRKMNYLRGFTISKTYCRGRQD